MAPLWVQRVIGLSVLLRGFGPSFVHQVFKHHFCVIDLIFAQTKPMSVRRNAFSVIHFIFFSFEILLLLLLQDLTVFSLATCMFCCYSFTGNSHPHAAYWVLRCIFGFVTMRLFLRLVSNSAPQIIFWFSVCCPKFTSRGWYANICKDIASHVRQEKPEAKIFGWLGPTVRCILEQRNKKGIQFGPPFSIFLPRLWLKHWNEMGS